MEYNIVTNLKIINLFKESNFFNKNLGSIGTVETDNGEDRILNQRDKFAFFYNKTYRTVIYGQGSIGKIMFYLDHYIKDDIIAIYKDEEEFLFDLDYKRIREHGINSYVGYLMKEVDSKVENKKSNIIEKEVNEENSEVKKGDPNKLINNPGQVRWEDLQAYIRNKSLNRI